MSATEPTCGQFGPAPLDRRQMLRRAGFGIGSLALTSLLADEQRLFASDDPDELPLRPAEGRARNVIFLFMGGGPSQVDSFDPKPLLQKLNGQRVPDSIAAGIPRIARSPLTNLFASPYKFRQYGQSGIPVSEMFPEVGRHVDDLCVIRSCRHSSPIHAPAEYWMTTGSPVGDRPSLGSWLTYGLGSENANLPGFVVFVAGSTGRPPAWSSGFLPARYQGNVVKAEGFPDLEMPAGTTRERRRDQLDLMAELNLHHLRKHAGPSDLEARIRSYELAFAMQSTAAEAFDLKGETRATQASYGIGAEETDEYGKYCLLARRLVERGVRFVQVRSGGWDAHGNLVKNHTPQARKTDLPIAGLLADLKARGLLKHTLVVWGGEFGRTPTAENPGPTPGRNHSPSGFTMWLAGGGVKGGRIIGATDEVGYAAVEKPILPCDLHATLLHALGIPQKSLYYRHNNRKELVTVNGGQVVEEVFA